MAALGVALTALQSCATSVTPTAAVAVISYTDGTESIAVAVPNGWEIADFGEGERALIVVTPGDLDVAEVSAEAALDVPVFAVTVLPTLQTDAVQALEEDLAEEFAAWSEPTQGQLMGHPMAEALLEYPARNGTAMRELRAVVLADSREVRIRGIAPAVEWERYGPVFRDMLESVRVDP